MSPYELRMKPGTHTLTALCLHTRKCNVQRMDGKGIWFLIDLKYKNSWSAAAQIKTYYGYLILQQKKSPEKPDPERALRVMAKETN